MPSPATLQALESLKKLSTTPYQPQFDSSMGDTNVQRYLGFQDTEGELKDRVFANQRAQAASPTPQIAAQYGGEVTALKNMLGSTEQDIAESPITAQIADTNDQTTRLRGAQEQGFSGQNPIQEQALYAKKQAEEKLNLPLREQELQNTGNLTQQREVSRGNLDVANAKGAQLEAAISAAYASGRPIHSFSGSGGVAFETPQKQSPVNSSLLRDVTAASAALKAAQDTGMLGRFIDPQGIPNAQLLLNQALGKVFGQAPGSTDLKELAAHILNDPELAGLPINELIPHIQSDEGPMRPEDLQALQTLLNYGRGIVGGGAQ